MAGMLLNRIKKAGVLPRISDTERAALEAGSVWVDGQFFSGNPDFKAMLAEAYPELPDEERAFIDGPVEELMHRVDMWQLTNTRRIPDDIWQFLRDNGFFGLAIPKEYGGRGFSTLARSTIMMKTASLGPVGTLVVIPNTLGAGELLIHYGTKAQKEHYLPKLAAGEYVPCFALTEPTAGSDAASIRAEGVVFTADDGNVKIRLNFAKRYITLAPFANLVSLAVRLHDPDNLLGKGEDVGITVVMLHKGTPGLEQGDHHLPISAFDNGPVRGRDVIIPADDILGGRDHAGQGWRMLMEQLSGGRAVSLPASGVAAARLSAAAAGPYGIVREQFGIPVGRMEGVQTRVARIAAMAYAVESARVYVCAGIDNDIQPPVISAILKQHITELGRQLVVDGMDVMAGAGVMQGPNNILGGAYRGSPVNVTVEGANILTRTLIVFGQGAVRCHPYALNMLNAIESDDSKAFNRALRGWVGHSLANFCRGMMRGLTRGRTFTAPVSGETAQYYRKLAWAAARFAWLTDLAMILIGGKLKQRGNLSGRMADVLSWMLLAFTTLRRYEAEGRREEDLPVVHWAVQYSLQQIQDAFEGIYANFDVPVIGWWLRHPGRFWLRINALSRGPVDAMNHSAAAAIQQPGDLFERIATHDMGEAREDEPGLGRLLHAWTLVAAAQTPTRKVSRALRKGELDGATVMDALDEAEASGLIDPDEAAQIRAAENARNNAIQVDEFAPEAYYRDKMPARGGSA